MTTVGMLLDRSAVPFRAHEACRAYASVAAVLAGFCFAAVVLIVSLQQGNVNLKAQALVQAEAQTLTELRAQGALSEQDAQAGARKEAGRQAKQLNKLTAANKFDRAIGAFLAAFVGLVMSSFLMARVGGRAPIEDTSNPSPRTLWLVLLASVTLATSSLFALWGLAELITVVLDRPNVITLVRTVFVVTSILAAGFVVAAAHDVPTTALEVGGPPASNREAPKTRPLPHARAYGRREPGQREIIDDGDTLRATAPAPDTRQRSTANWPKTTPPP